MRISDIHLELGVTPRRGKDDSRRNLGADWHTRGLPGSVVAGVKERVRKSGREERRGRERQRGRETERACEGGGGETEGEREREIERDPFWSTVSFRVGSHAPVGVHVPSAITNRKTRLPRTEDTFLG